jgi:hypothetical protein
MGGDVFWLGLPLSTWLVVSWMDGAACLAVFAQGGVLTRCLAEQLPGGLTCSALLCSVPQLSCVFSPESEDHAQRFVSAGKYTNPQAHH